MSHRLAAGWQVFARNRLVIVVAPGNPEHVRRIADLSRHGLVVVLADPSVPAGKYAAEALADAGVHVRPASLEDNVRSVLTKVRLGEADAGIVYRTDALSAGSAVATVDLPTGPVAAYPIAAVDGHGRQFVDFVLSAQGRQILAQFGFLPP